MYSIDIDTIITQTKRRLNLWIANYSHAPGTISPTPHHTSQMDEWIRFISIHNQRDWSYEESQALEKQIEGLRGNHQIFLFILLFEVKLCGIVALTQEFNLVPIRVNNECKDNTVRVIEEWPSLADDDVLTVLL